MSLYTRSGDDGTTLMRGERILKSHPKVVACGGLDELQCLFGVAASMADAPTRTLLCRLQQDLFVLNAELAGYGSDCAITPVDVCRLEELIDRCEAHLPPLRQFILPGGSTAGALLHLARAVARRAEREIVHLAQTEHVPSSILAYVNRLSDLLFVLARRTNMLAGSSEEPWSRH